jgi:hypothetical protein
MKSLFTRQLQFLLLLCCLFQLQVSAQTISGPATICPGTGTVRYSFNNVSPCTNLQWHVTGGPVAIIGTANNYIDLQFPSVPADVTYKVNVGYLCTTGDGNTSKDVLIKKGPAIETHTIAIPCSFQGNYAFQVDAQQGAYFGVQWSTNTGWLSGNTWPENGPGGITYLKKEYGVNNLNGGYVKAVLLGLQCNNAPTLERTYNIIRTPDASLPAPSFAPGTPTTICGTTTTSVSVTPPALVPSGYRWYSVPENALKINGGFYNSESAALLTSTPSVSIQVASAQSANATLYVSAVYPGGCNSAPATQSISIAPGVVPPFTIIDDLVSPPGLPTDYRFYAPALGGVTYNWYVNGNLIVSSPNYIYRRIVPCRSIIDVSCSITNACGMSAQSEAVTVIGGCRETRSAGFVVSPNPANNIVTITAKNNVTVKSAEQSPMEVFNEVNIFDFQGNLVKRRQYTGTKQGTIEVGDLRTGTYYIEIRNGQHAEKQTLIIQK